MISSACCCFRCQYQNEYLIFHVLNDSELLITEISDTFFYILNFVYPSFSRNKMVMIVESSRLSVLKMMR